jgi:hypothetical protein
VKGEGVKGDFLDGLQELLFIPGATPHHFSHFPASGKTKRMIRRFEHHELILPHPADLGKQNFAARSLDDS